MFILDCNDCLEECSLSQDVLSSHRSSCPNVITVIDTSTGTIYGSVNKDHICTSKTIIVTEVCM